MRIALYLFPVVLAVYAFVDCVLDRPRPAPYAPRFIWLLAIVFIPVLGPLGWLLASKLLRENPPARPAGQRPAAPDDDPTFLRGLNRKDPGPKQQNRPPGHAGED